jgi:hypothetical protein
LQTLAIDPYFIALRVDSVILQMAAYNFAALVDNRLRPQVLRRVTLGDMCCLI